MEAPCSVVEQGFEKAITSAVERKIEHLASKSDLVETKADIIKWMFIFWMGLLIPLGGLLIAILKE